VFAICRDNSADI